METFINYIKLYKTMEEKIRPLTLWINKKVWDEFKEKVPRSITLNEAIITLIKNDLLKQRGVKNEPKFSN